MSHIIEEFNGLAVQLNLSANAILLWQRLYFTMERKEQWVELQIDTVTLTNRLHISRQGLIQVRQTLMENGLLAVRQDESQKNWYTLLMFGKTIPELIAKKEKQQEQRSLSEAAKQAFCEPLANPEQEAIKPPVLRDSRQEQLERQYAMVQETQSATVLQPTMAVMEISHSGREVILSRAYQEELQEFYEQTGDRELRGALLRWAEMRLQNGWDLTKWGLDALLQKLQQLGEQDPRKMLDIVIQSLKRRWKGFHELRIERKPSGEKLRKLEEKEARQMAGQSKNRSLLPKFKGGHDVDLSFLEE